MAESKLKIEVAAVQASEGADAVLKALNKAGGVIIKGLLTKDQVARVNAEIDGPLYEANPGGPPGLDEGTTESYGSNTKRLTNLVTRSPTFRKEILDHGLVHEITKKQLVSDPSMGYWFSSAQVIEIGPGNKAQPLHRDQDLYPSMRLMGPTGPEVMVNFLIALTPFTDENGATRIIPGSHQYPTFDDYDVVSKLPTSDTDPAVMEPGDCILITGKVIHGGGNNKTLDQYRRGVAFTFIQSYIVPEEAHTLLVPREIVEDMSYRAQAMIGFRSRWPIDYGANGALWQHDFKEIGGVIGLKSTDGVAA